MTTADDLDALKRDHGARWEVWIVPLALEKAVVWCARLHTNHRKVLKAYTPGHLAEYIRDADSEA